MCDSGTRTRDEGNKCHQQSVLSAAAVLCRSDTAVVVVLVTVAIRSGVLSIIGQYLMGPVHARSHQPGRVLTGHDEDDAARQAANQPGPGIDAGLFFAMAA
jgi:hypothetical protein